MAAMSRAGYPGHRGIVMGILDLGRYKGIVFAITGFLVFIAIILAMNHAMVGRFADDAAGINFLSQMQVQPKVVHDSAALIAARLKEGEKVEDAIETLRKSASAFDHGIIGLGDGYVADASGETIMRSALVTPDAERMVTDGKKIWEGYKTKLDPILRFSGSPYASETPAAAAPTAPAGKGTVQAQPVVEKTVHLSPRG